LDPYILVPIFHGGTVVSWSCIHPSWNERWRDEHFSLKCIILLIMANYGEPKQKFIEKYSHTSFVSMTVANCVSMNSMFLVCEKHR
jgi:hypothetical protein